MIDTADDFLAGLNARLEQGARDYGNQSMVRPVAELVEEIRQELLDEVGWVYVLWCVGWRKANGAAPELDLREKFLHVMRHRLTRNDRGTLQDVPLVGARALLTDLEVLAMDMFEHAQRIGRRLQPIARAIEVAQAINPHRGPRGSTRDPRST